MLITTVPLELDILVLFLSKKKKKKKEQIQFARFAPQFYTSYSKTFL